MRSQTWIESHSRSHATDGVTRTFLRCLAEGFRRARQRRDLAALSEHNLRDIGLTRDDVAFETRKPFWRM